MMEMSESMRAAIEKMDETQQRSYKVIVKALNAGKITDEDVHNLFMSSKRIMGQTWFAPEALSNFKASTGRAVPDLAKKLVERLPLLPAAAQNNIMTRLIDLCAQKIQAEAEATAPKKVPPKTPKMDPGM